ncbi:DUF484 family protein [Catenovulum sp. SM1970]|uniref:DUF484 family protein n=1 Tax=Marinifaba aquimaris TaxID=2741323 RepID=UPI0015731F88|nr:DUF484 family protein [Marinifaba aquimaris]NTS76734.1 DUF484 family protein [Marinifaba aquimaris]
MTEQAELIDLSAEDLVHFLQENPDFFDKHPDTLAKIKLPHNERGSVSLLERQQEILRNKNIQLEQNIQKLIQTASQNERIYKAFVNLYMALLECPDSKQLLYVLNDVLIDQIQLDAVKLTLFIANDDSNTAKLVQPRSRFLDVLEKRLSRDTYYFGRLPQSELELFFDPEKDIHSVALVRLGDQKDLGILAFGSSDDSHFQPEMDTVFLEPMVKLINRILFDFTPAE